MSEETVWRRQKWFPCVDLVPIIPARYVTALIASVGFIIVFALRVNLSMAMVVMANSSAINTNTHLVS